MTEPNDLGPKEGESAGDFKGRILETQRELKRAAAQAKATPEPVVPVIPPALAQVTPPKTEVITPPDAEPAQPAGTFVSKEAEEWWKKKGFKSVDDMTQSYRELERKMHADAEEAKRKGNQPAPVPSQVPPVQGYPPYYPVTPPPAYVLPQPPSYVPYQPPAAPPVNIERLAREYGFEPADFEKVAAVASDMADQRVKQVLDRVMPPLVSRIQNNDRELSRQREIVDLMGDPAFKNPQVQFEMHRVLEESPAIFERHAQPVRYAFEQALTRIARANLGGSTAPNPAPIEPVPVPAPKPPTTAGGNGGGGGGAPAALTPEQVTPEVFAQMPHEKKREHLQAIGAFGRG